MIVVLGQVQVRQGHLPAALALSMAHVQRSRAEPGCLMHAVHQDAEDPQRLVFVEQWADEAALRTHFKVPASRDFVDSLAQLCATRPRIDIYDTRSVPL
jgi:quinol monooxygenase YgiN